MTIINSYSAAYTLIAGGTVTVTAAGTVGAGMGNYGGVALSALSGGSVLNRGEIEGGVGEYGYGTGGAGLSIAGAVIARNSGQIGGGTGGYGYGGGGSGGVGAVVNGATLSNLAGGTITGGDAGANAGGRDSFGGDGGHGVDVTNGVFVNAGTVVGGQGGGGYYNGTNGLGVDLSGASRLTNDKTGRISGSNGLEFEASGSGMLQNFGTIDGSFTGVVLGTAADTVMNAGVIAGGMNRGGFIFYPMANRYFYSGRGLTMSDGGRLTNSVGATISGFAAVLTKGTVGASITNLGTITGASEAGYTYSGYYGSIVVLGGTGVRMTAGGRLVNDAGGDISGYDGLAVSGTVATTVTNFGTIASTGTGGAAVTFASAADILIEEGSGVLTGAVHGGGGKLELAPGAGTGTIGGLGGSITGFGEVEILAGAGWHFAGNNTIAASTTLSSAAALIVDGTLINHGRIDQGALIQLSTGARLTNGAGARLMLTGAVNISPASGATGTQLLNGGLLQRSGTGLSNINVALVNTGTVIAAAGVLDLRGAVSGTGLMHINSGATLEFASSVTAGTKVAFTAGSGEVLEIANGGAAFKASVQGFAAGDTLDLASIPFGAGTKVSYSSSAKTLTVSNGAAKLTIALVGQYAAAGFSAASNGHGGTDVTYAPPPAPALATLAVGRG